MDGDLAPWEPARVAVGLLAQGGSSRLKMPWGGSLHRIVLQCPAAACLT